MSEQPQVDYEVVVEWFDKCAKTAARMGKAESATLWRDGKAHLEHMKAQVDEVTKQRDELLQALKLPTKYGVYVSIHGYVKGDEFLKSRGWDEKCSPEEFFELKIKQAISNARRNARLRITRG